MNKLLIPITILVLATFLRFVNLANNPPALYWDEVSIGYNAFSILKTGADEHQVTFPVTHFLAYGDAKPPLYIYSVAVSIAIFGVNEFAVRFPSALSGSLAVLIVFYLTKIFFKDQKEIFLKILGHRFPVFNLALPTLTALLLAISPWHLQMSRVGFEANLALTLFLAGFLIFLQSFIHRKLLPLSAIFFVATLYTFNAYRIFLPLFIIFLAIAYRHQLKKFFKWALFSFSLGTVLILPLATFLLSSQAQLRFNEVSIFKNHDPIIEANLRSELNHNSLWSRIIYNRRVLFLQEFLIHYTDQFKPDFLFVSGDVNPRLSTRDQGGLYLIELPLLLIGLFYLIKQKSHSTLLLIAWALLAFIPPGIARETPHALRSLQIIPIPQILVSLGIISLLLKHKRLMAPLIILYSLFFISYLNTYHLQYPKHWASSWQYGYKQLVNYISSVQDNYDKVFITKSLGRPHSYFLFYQKYDPQKYWATRDASGDAFGFTYVNGFDKYRFGDIDPFDTRGEQKWLLVSRPDGVPSQTNYLSTISDLNGEPVFVITEAR